MNENKIMELIAACQQNIKNDLMPEHAQSKFEYLMLLRSFDLLKNYILKNQQSEKKLKAVLGHYFKIPIESSNEAIEYLCRDIRQNFHPDQFEILCQLNEEDLQLTQSRGG